ncbi:unnamed protein product [Sphagnum troendelagicum]|uniref:Uncharacterized protein n=1 Tax=Sphagnum troendelagicum TaxID=128251 RepID=A0ABP0UHG4_9BRYO
MAVKQLLPTRPDLRGGKRQFVGEEPIQLPEPRSEVRTQIGLHEFGCLSVPHQNNVPRAMLSDTAFLGLLTTLVSRKRLPAPQSDEAATDVVTKTYADALLNVIAVLLVNESGHPQRVDEYTV